MKNKLLKILSVVLFIIGTLLVLYGISRMSLTACCICCGLVILYLGVVIDVSGGGRK